ncbi:AmiS/UreI family transporter [Arthrobacter oryzae]|uniref:AmiS/UreI transporter n=1 Tax=Arthrobacter oryzae TaxID=409290 RepID=A0A3N0BJW1_9MICC|nr:AmiS/UreI family transporter [Arthrobacter oryzae]RNL48699.1 AmiS/UreI transporter [Arthrobacter oryzae]
MPYLCLLLSGAALLVNGLALLGRIPLRDSAVFSLLIGATQLALGITYVSTADVSAPGTLLGAAGMFLFGLTYVYVGLDALLGLGSKGLGWYSGLVAVFAVLLSAAWLPADPFLAVLWLCWAVLWSLFFVRMALGCEPLGPFIGWSLVLTSQVTATLPAFLGLAGYWPYDRSVAAGAAVVVVLLLVAAGRLGWRSLRGGNATAAVPEAVRTAVR